MRQEGWDQRQLGLSNELPEVSLLHLRSNGMRGIEKAKKVFSVVMGNEVHKIKYENEKVK
jgi:hypothetical protein